MIFENQMPGIRNLKEPVKLGKIEPWMVDFVKEKHSQEEWDAFFEYYRAGPLRRAMSYIAGFLISILPVRRIR